MSFNVTPNSFETEDEVTARFEDMGCAVLAGDFPANELGLHWHSFDYLAAVVSGSLRLSDASGSEAFCEAGTLVDMPLGRLHTEANTAGRFVFGFPAGEVPDITINHDPADHPDA